MARSGDRLLTDSIGRISGVFGLSPRVVRRRIHNAKKGMPRNTAIRNPDVVVDLATGEIYPQTSRSSHGDSIGNVQDPELDDVQ